MEVDSELLQKRFEAAVKVIKSLPPDGPFQPSNDMMLKFYSYYKQATIGECNTPRPSFWDAVGKAKWDAWNSLGNMSKEAAMESYVNEMKLILESMPMTSEVEDLLLVLGPFYELIDEKKKISEISDLSTARLTQFARQLEGFGSVMNSVPSSSMKQSIIRNLEMNGTRPAKPKHTEAIQQEEEDLEDKDEDDEKDEDEEDDEDYENDEDEEAERLFEDKKDKISATFKPKKLMSIRRHKAFLSNGKMTNGRAKVINGSHSRSVLNCEDPQEGSMGEALPNGHHAEVASNHVASDSDSEVYCDSVDQFGREENSEHNRSLDELDVPAPVDEPREEPPQAARCGVEEAGPSVQFLQRIGLNLDQARRPTVRRMWGGFSDIPIYDDGGGDGEPWSDEIPVRRDLSEEIVQALARLREDMEGVLDRLHSLEALAASQTRPVALSPSLISPPSNRKKPSWWPFDISPTSLAFAVIWPFVVQWLIRLYLQRRRRRIN